MEKWVNEVKKFMADTTNNITEITDALVAISKVIAETITTIKDLNARLKRLEANINHSEEIQ